MSEIFENLDLQNLEGEIWKTIEDFPDYKISNLGRVKSLKHGKEKILKQCKNTDGYFHVGLSKNGKQKNKKVNQLVSENHK